MLAPRIIILSNDQWVRAGLRAELREHGYDAIGAQDIEHAERYVLPDPERGPVRLVIADQDLMDERGIDTLRRWRKGLDCAVVLLAHATRAVPAGDWDEVLRRPFSLADVEAVVSARVPLAPADAHPLDV